MTVVSPANEPIVFSRPYRTEAELANLGAVLASHHSHGDGPFTFAAASRLRELTGAPNALLTTSCTTALDMSAMLLDLGPGDEVIMPTFTFASAGTSVAARGATCVFVDLDPATGNVDPEKVAEAVTSSTRAIMVMHYGGVPVDMDAIGQIAATNGLAVIEDNAHGLGVHTARGALGTLGTFGTQSFHDTKNVHSGEGGALFVNDERYLERAEILREKGTNRANFMRGQVDKYTWHDIGGSFLMSELNAAVLDAQLAEFGLIQSLRTSVWDSYAEGLRGWADRSGVVLMSDTADLVHASHLFYLLVPTPEDQAGLLAHLRAQGVYATFHYVPLDSSPAGHRFGRTQEPLARAADFASRLVRLPLWAGMTTDQIERVISAVESYRMQRVRVG